MYITQNRRMNLEISTYHFGQRPDVTRPHTDFLKLLGEDGIRKMVNKHYDLMRESAISHLFPMNELEFEKAKVHSADFMIQICGGPDYFNQNRGRPLLIQRHAPFEIDEKGRDVWLKCYKVALLETQLPDNLILSFWNYINVFSAWMINKR